MIKNLLCNGQEYLLNADDDIYFTWDLTDCIRQLGFTFRLFQDEKQIVECEEETANCVFHLTTCALKPLTTYRYSVEVRTDGGRFIKEGEFLSGLTEGFGEAQWISDGEHPDISLDKVGNPAVYFRRKFTLAFAPKLAIANMIGLGIFVFYINGRRVGKQVLEPAFTDYRKSVLYSTFLVQEYLREGENEIEVVLGDGWYNQTTQDVWGFYKAAWRDNPKLLFRLDYDGNTLVSDEEWEFSYGRIIANAIRAGETWDFNATKNYQQAKKALPVGGQIKPAQLPPIMECETISPISVKTSKSKTIVDFGKNIAGYISACFQGEKGEEIKIVYSDRLCRGECDNSSNGKYITNKEVEYQTDKLILSGGTDEFKPQFVYHGFRYAIVLGNVSISNLKAHFVHTDLQRVGNFFCDDEDIQMLYDMSINSILSNYHGFPEDCPHREKNGWTGDAQLSSNICVYTFAMQQAYRKWLEDILDNQTSSGQISAIIPSAGWGFAWGSGPAWDYAFFAISRLLYAFYGDEQIIRKVYPALQNYYAYISSFVKEGLLCVGLGDWNYPKKANFAICPTELTDSCFYMQMSKILCELAKKYGGDCTEYENNCKIAKRSILRKYAQEGSVTGMAALTYFGVLDRTNEVREYLRQNDYKVHFGILGNKFIMSTLAKAEDGESLYKLLKNQEYPCFYTWIKDGQTSLCEDFELTNSLNHHMFSCMSEYMIKCFVGLRLKNRMEATLSPSLPEKINEVSASSNGFEASVRRVGKEMEVRFVVPCNKSLFLKGKKYTTGIYTVVL